MIDKEDRLFVRNFSLTIALLFTVMVILIVVANKFHDELTPGENPIAEAAVEERITPATQVLTGDAPPPTPEPDVDEEPLTGEQVYNQICTSCHTAGVAGAPMLGSDDWKARVAKGVDGLYTNAINGYQGDAGFMPAKGGNPSFSDDEVRGAVDYMVAQGEG